MLKSANVTRRFSKYSNIIFVIISVGIEIIIERHSKTQLDRKKKSARG